MAKYIAGRLLGAIPVLFGIATLVFLMMRMLPGDPAQLMLAGSGASAQQIADLRPQLGLDEPLPQQYATFLVNAATGNFGRSVYTKQPVMQMLVDQLPPTMELAFSSTLLGLLVGIPLGVLAAL